MNCNCDPPLPAVCRQTQKAGDNFGRWFYSCPRGACKLFVWANNAEGTGELSSVYGRGNGSRYVRKDASMETGTGGVGKLCKIMFGIGKVEGTLPQKIWFSVIAPNEAWLENYYNKYPFAVRKRCPSTRVMLFDLSIYESFLTGLKECPQVTNFTVVPLPRFLAEGLPAYLKSLPTPPVPDPNLMPLLRATLMPFQLEGLNYVIRHGGRALIADEMGCGKTMSAIGVLEHYRDRFPALIMLPASLARQWKEELLKHGADLFDEKDISILSKATDRVKGKISLVPYSIMDKLVEKDHIRPQGFGIVIADECHNLKNREAKRTNVSTIFLKEAAVAICLSGTPVVNRPVELFTQLSALLPRVFCNYDEFIKRYCDARTVPYGNKVDAKGSSNMQELNILLEGIVMLRRFKKDVVKLPQKKRQFRNILLDPKYTHQLRSIQSEMESLKKQEEASRGVDESITDRIRRKQQQQLLRYKQVTGLAKVYGVCGIIQEFVSKFRVKDSEAPPLDGDGNGGCAASSSVMTEIEKPIVIDLADDNIDHSCDDANLNTITNHENFIAASTSLVSDATPEFYGKLEDDIFCGQGDAKGLMGVTGGENNLMVDSDDDVTSCLTGSPRPTALWRLKRVSELNYSNSNNSSKPSKQMKVGVEADVSEGRRRNGGRLLRSSSKAAATASPTLKAKDSIYRSNDDSDGEDLFFVDRMVVDGGMIMKDTKPPIKKRKQWEDAEEEGHGTTSGSDIDLMFGGGGKKLYPDVVDSECSDDAEVDDDDDVSHDRPEGNMDSKSAWKKLLDGSSKLKHVKDKKNGDSKLKKRQREDGKILNKKNNRSKSGARDHDGLNASAPIIVRRNRLKEKIIIFAYHIEVLDQIEAFIQDMEVDYIRLDGSSSTSSRNTSVLDFQYRDKADVALLSLMACGTGLNLTAASTAIFAELDWSPGTMDQAEDRIHRIGQKAAVVNIVYVIAKDSGDDIVSEQLKKKHHVVDATVGASDAYTRNHDSRKNGCAQSRTMLDFTTGKHSQKSQDFDSETMDLRPAGAVSAADQHGEGSRNGNMGPHNSASVVYGPSKSTSETAKPSTAASVYGGIGKESTSRPEEIIHPSSAVGLTVQDIDEIPLELIEQQILLAKEMIAKAKQQNPQKASDAGSQKDLLQSIRLEASQFDYPISQMVINNSPAKNLTLKSTGKNSAILSKESTVYPATNTKPVLGWSIKPASQVYETPVQLGNEHSHEGLEKRPSSRSEALHPKGDINVPQPSSKPLDEATRLKIEENRRQALLRLQRHKEQVNVMHNGPDATERSKASMKLAQTAAKITPPEVPAISTKIKNRHSELVCHDKNSNSFFSTGKGKTVAVSSNALAAAETLFAGMEKSNKDAASVYRQNIHYDQAPRGSIQTGCHSVHGYNGQTGVTQSAKAVISMQGESMILKSNGGTIIQKSSISIAEQTEKFSSDSEILANSSEQVMIQAIDNNGTIDIKAVQQSVPVRNMMLAIETRSFESRRSID